MQPLATIHRLSEIHGMQKSPLQPITKELWKARSEPAIALLGENCSYDASSIGEDYLRVLVKRVPS